MKSPLNYYFSNNKKRLTSIASLLQYQQWYYSMKVFMEQMTQHREHAIISEEMGQLVTPTKRAAIPQAAEKDGDMPAS